VPKKQGVTLFDDIDLNELVPYIDWTFFFHAWELKGRYPNILEDADKGETARELFSEAQAMLKKAIDEKWLTAKAIVGIFPASATDDDDVTVWLDGGKATRFHFLRKQTKQPDEKYNESLADYIAPQSTGLNDYMGGFACTTGLGIDTKLAEFKAAHDDHSSIMLSTLADRLAEACAEWLHKKVRTDLWGYNPNENLDNEALIKEQYQGIRPAIGYPASPDHTEKDILWDLLDIEKQTGIWLTEHKAMVPTAAVSGLYFSHPESRYFAVSKISKDQVEDYANRKDMELSEMEKWLAPNLGY
jgi:5-methyltetrahydrofolate--homocysteine methyltransferase